MKNVNNWEKFLKENNLLKPEFRFKENRLDKSYKWVEQHRDEIHPSISFIQAVELYDMGIDPTQINPVHNQLLNNESFMKIIKFNEPYDYHRFEDYLIDVDFNDDDLLSMDWQNIKNEFSKWLEDPESVKKSRM